MRGNNYYPLPITHYPLPITIFFPQDEAIAFFVQIGIISPAQNLEENIKGLQGELASNNSYLSNCL
ncbi:hypothetical protein NIES2107_46610 [Nostoc carneum NIES-2107]|nr:hypothetical protein NIES2107_46610 [Nostoc carneum NIES-2107]